MARTPEQVLRDYIGDQVITLARMTAELEVLREQVALYKPKLDRDREAYVGKTNGQDHADHPPS